jgi:sirohydrochlorin cobaltochelatase
MKKFRVALCALALLCAMLTTGFDSKDGKAAILVVSFGTSYNESRDLTIGGIENAIQEKYPDYEVRRAFTSQIIIDKLKERDGLEIDNVTEALDRAAADGVTELIVQPTHLMHGFEYTDLQDELEKYTDKFDKVVMGEPLLNSDDDFSRVADVLAEDTADYIDGKTAVVFMGHGTEADSNEVYTKLQTMIADAGFANYYIGTVEAEPGLEDVVQAAKDGGYKKVVLEPLMIVCGDHANNDMAGDEEDSWKSVFEKEGFEVECVMRGLGELPEIQDLLAEHAKKAIDGVQ